MKKIFLILVTLVSIAFCKSLDNGFYISKECPSTIINVDNSLAIYNVDSKKDISYFYNKKGKYYTLTKTREFYPLDNSGLIIDNSKNFKMFDYNKVTRCKGKSSYKKINSIKELAAFLSKLSNFKFSYNFYSDIKNKFLIDKSNVVIYNNLAYDIYKNGYYQQADYLLKLVLERFPNRTVAYLNYADNLDKLMNQKRKVYYDFEDRGLTEYYLTYISQMLFKNKENLIPQRVKTKYQKYFSILKQLNQTLKEPFVILGFSEGYINEDYKKDISFVIEFADSKKIKDAKRYSNRLSNSNLRAWLVFFKDKENYRLVSKNTTLLKPDKIANCDDPFSGFHINKNAIFLNLHYWCSMGGWGQGGTTYQVIYRNKQLILAGLESWNDSRADGKGSKISMNFLTKKKIYYKTIDHGDEVGDAKLGKIKAQTPVFFKDIYEWGY